MPYLEKNYNPVGGTTAWFNPANGHPALRAENIFKNERSFSAFMGPEIFDDERVQQIKRMVDSLTDQNYDLRMVIRETEQSSIHFTRELRIYEFLCVGCILFGLILIIRKIKPYAL
jgi:hypothetical protein